MESDMILVEISEDLRDLVSSTINSVREGMKEEKCGVSGTIKFEVSVAKSKEAKTGFKIFVADASGNYTKDNISKITFEIAGLLSDSEKTDLKNQISQLQNTSQSNISKITQFTNQIQKLDSNVASQLLIITKKNIEIESLNNQVKDLNTQLERSQQQIQNLLRQIEQLDRMIQNKNREINDLKHPKPKPVS
jgi:chromosome segregation ATPase